MHRRVFIVILALLQYAVLAQEPADDTTAIDAAPVNVAPAVTAPANTTVADSTPAPVKAKPKRAVYTDLGASRVKSTYTFMPGNENDMERGIYIPNTTGSSPKISQLRIFLSRRGYNNAPFFFHIYEYDPVTGQPGMELYPGGIRTSNLKGGRWEEIDVSSYNLTLPPSGVVLTCRVPKDNYRLYPDSSLQGTTSADRHYKYFTYPLLSGARDIDPKYHWHRSNGRWVNLANTSFLSPALGLTVVE